MSIKREWGQATGMDSPSSPQDVPPPLPPDAQERIDAALAALGYFGAAEASTAPEPPSRWRRLSTWAAVYAVVLAAIAFWPEPVDARAGDLTAWIIRAVPGLTYQRLEFGANIALFLPFGLAVGALLRQHRYLVLPLAVLTSLTVEGAQAVLIPARTPSLFDILANVSGASLGLVALVIFEEVRRRRPPREDTVATLRL